MIKAIFFDMDGVLTTDKTGTVTSCKYYSKKLNKSFQELFDLKRRTDEITDKGEVRGLITWKEIAEDAGVQWKYKWEHEAHISTPIDSKMIAYAKKLKTVFKVGIITDNKTDRANAIVEKNKLQDIFNPIIVSADVKCTKADTQIFEIACKRIGLNGNECIFIDNTPKNLISAEKLGMIGIYFDDQIRDYVKLYNEVDKIVENDQ